MRPRAKLAWRCRRGKKELDLLLEPFVDRRLASLSDREARTLERLLDAPDDEILALLCGTVPPADEELAALLRAIRSVG